jgi:hypothetical protein
MKQTARKEDHMKLAIVVGHNSASPSGAVRQDTGESEFVWNGRLARRIDAGSGNVVEQ